MSNWTHVAGVIRIDDFRLDESHSLSEKDFDFLIGKECLYSSSRETWKDMTENSDNYLPHGSEGTLRKIVWINPDIETMVAYTITIFGDLRDHNSAKDIIKWFKKKCLEIEKNHIIRNAIICAENEFNGSSTWRY